MLLRLQVNNFKSLRKTEVELPRFSVLFGPNSSGKSNFLDALQVLSRLGTLRTLSDALAQPIRGHPLEAFSLPEGGLQALLRSPSACFEIEADLQVAREVFRYRVAIAMAPASGHLSVRDEYLAVLGRTGEPKGRPAIERRGDQLYIRRKSKPAHPRQEAVGLNHTILSDPRLAGVEYKAVERVREELSGWCTYYLDPRVSMRRAQPPSDVRDIGLLGEEIAPFLYRLRSEQEKAFQAVVRTLRAIIPSVETLTVDLDERRGTLDILIRQDGTDFSSRIVSEGTLRVLGLCTIAANPWGGSLVAFEEPENGVHPRRLDLIAKLLFSLASESNRQVVVTTHSPFFCDLVLRETRFRPDEVRLFNVRREKGATVVKPVEVTGPLFSEREVAEALSSETEDGLFESLLQQGLLDE